MLWTPREGSFCLIYETALQILFRGNPVFASLSDQPPDYLELNKEGLDWDRIAEKVSLDI
jgi:hypothetical protein